jgi:TPP-dependent pyruvate/acetoin dehydrogenase alpha subunit
MHIAALHKGVLGANGIVGAGMGLGTGAALSAQMRKSDQVVVAFFGDGAANEGIARAVDSALRCQARRWRCRRIQEQCDRA